MTDGKPYSGEKNIKDWKSSRTLIPNFRKWPG